MKNEKGFTLIELVVVIVILGILAATALPKFVDLRSEAASAATQGVAGALSSGFSLNYGARMANSNKGVAISATNQACSDAAAIAGVMQGGLPTGYTLSTNGVNCSSAGATAACAVSGQNGTSASFTLICTG